MSLPAPGAESGEAHRLLDPLILRTGTRSRNRTVLAAMTNGQSRPDGSLGDEELHWLNARADGGFGIVTTCAAHVSRDGQGWAGELGVFDDFHVPGLRRLADALHGRGALALAQIFHGGLRANPTLTGEQPWSASTGPGSAHRAAAESDIQRVICDFAAAAARTHAAGMDGVEVHGAHGYLLTQFLSAVDNRREDRWGGPLENRARLIREVVRAARAKVSERFVVGVRLSPEDYGNARGLDLDESVQVAQWLCEDGADFIHLSLWDALKNTTKRPGEHALQVFRTAVRSDVPLLVAGNIWTRADAERMLDLGASGVALGRAAIANPDWPLRIADRGWAPRRFPLTSTELRERSVSDGFVEYLRKSRGLVAT